MMYIEELLSQPSRRQPTLLTIMAIPERLASQEKRRWYEDLAHSGTLKP